MLGVLKGSQSGMVKVCLEGGPGTLRIKGVGGSRSWSRVKWVFVQE